MKYKICNKWVLEIPDFDLGEEELRVYTNKDVRTMPYTHAVVRRTVDSAKGAWCYEQMCKLFQVYVPISNVIEYYGGLGRASMIIERMLHPAHHFIYELDTFCASIIKANLPECNVLNESCIGKVMHADISFLDSNTSSILWVQDQWKWFNRIFGASNTVVITDTAISRFHLHKTAYSNRFGRQITTMEDYWAAFSVWVWERTNFSIKCVITHPHASYCIFDEAKKFISFEVLYCPPSAKSCFVRI